MRRILPLLLLLLILPLPAFANGNALLIGESSSGVPTITLYQGPSAYAPPAAYCYPGTQAEVMDQGSGFVQIRIGSFTGWAAREHLLLHGEWSIDDVQPLPAGEIVTLGAERYQYLFNLPDGTPFAALECHFAVSVLAITADDEWLFVQLPDGTTGCVPVEAALPANVPHAYVTGSDPSLRLHLRVSPTTKCDSLGNYYCGAEVAALFTANAADGWTRVSIGGQKGWMKTEYLSFSDTIGEWLPPLGIVQGTDASGLNLRAAPDYDAEIISRYLPGTAVEIMAVHGIWAHVRTQDGNVGYMLLRHLGGDQPAAVANASLLNGMPIKLLTSRPACAWQYSADSVIFALPDSCAVANAATGEIISAPTASLSIWEAAPADAAVPIA